MKLANNLGRVLRQARENLNLPVQQKDIARRIGVCNAYYSDIERGTRFPSYRVLKKICLFLDIPMAQAEQIAKDGLFARWKGDGE